jgi:hypothetical protein
VHGWEHHRDAARGGALLGRPGGGDGRDVACLHPEVEFFADGGGEPVGQAHRADRARPAGPVLKPGCHAQHDVQVSFQGRADPWALNLHGHLATRARGAAQPGPVHLGDRCGRGRLGV